MQCLYCLSEFEPTRPWQKFCTQAHKDAYHVEERKKMRFLQEQVLVLRAKVKEKEDENRELREELDTLKRQISFVPQAFTPEYIREVVDGH
jgi:predicted RNase H-like nuclease (RuvC/YqgF family)